MLMWYIVANNFFLQHTPRMPMDLPISIQPKLMTLCQMDINIPRSCLSLALGIIVDAQVISLGQNPRFKIM